MKRRFLLACLLTASPAWAASSLIDGTLHDKSGKPLANTSVELKNSQGKVIKSAQTDAKGHYAFESIGAGSYVLQAVTKDKVLGSTSLSLTDEQPLHKDLDLIDDQALHIVVAQKEPMRNTLSPKTGTNAYVFDQKAIDQLPQGEDTSLTKILLQAPGVAEDSAASGGLHIRGEHADLQYRLNGILLPDGISGFGDTIDSHIIQSATLLDGTLPAQYGFRTAGVVDIDTKTGFANGGTASLMVGSFGTIEPSFSYGGTLGNADYFVAASHLSSDLGIENPTSSTNAFHDHTEQNKEFGYASYMINDYQRLEMVAGNSISYFQIPNNPNQAPLYTLAGTTPNSATLNERQFESNQYLTSAWQGSNDGITVQIAPYIRNSELHFRPDATGDLLFNGVASDVENKDFATGLQNDNSWRINQAHTLRAGFTVQNDSVSNDSTTTSILTDAGGAPLVDGAGNNIASAPITNNHSKDGQLYGLYLQDEWKMADNLTVNYGARFDDMEQYVSANQLSPRIGVVYKPTDTTTLHAGYARYFTPPPMELVSISDIGAFNGTTNAPSVASDSQVKPERSNDFDAGITQKIGDHWQVGVDGYYKMVQDMLDEGQFGQALILTPFNYDRGTIYGSELSLNYTGEKLKGYANFAASRAIGEDISSSQFEFGADELAYIQNHYVHLDHDQLISFSSGLSYEIMEDLTAGVDTLFGSGLRDGFANTGHLPAYGTADLSIEQKFHIAEDPKDETAVRFTVTNITDSVYELRDGSGIGVGAPQYGARRGFFGTISQKF